VTIVQAASRPYGGEADLPAIVDMINACEAADQLDESTTAGDLRLEFSSPGFDPVRDLRLWEDADGKLIGFGQLWFHAEATTPDAFLWYKVHPDARAGDLDDQILAWGAQRARQGGAERGVRLKLVAVAHASDPARIATLERNGFAVARYFRRMTRPLDAPIAVPQLPEGFRLAVGPHDPQSWAALYNESFVDHWNHAPWTAAEVAHWQGDEHYRGDLDLVALAPDGTPAAFCWASIHPEENALKRRNDGQIGLLGTRRGFRSIGLGRAMLLAGMRALRAAGTDTVLLGVDADSPTGATRLYERVGMRVLHRADLFEKQL